jgi:dipeptidase E
MKKLFLASSINCVAQDIAEKITNPAELKLAFINTAAEVEQGDREWLENDRQGLINAGFNLFDYTLTNKTFEQIAADLSDADIVHLNGGNTFYLLLQARKSGFDQWITQAVASGKIYSGSSAGAIICAPDIEITKLLEAKIYQDQLKNLNGFNLVDFITLPHWGSDFFKELYLNQRLKQAYNTEHKIILLNDNQYVQVEGDKYKIVDVRD